MLKIFIQGLKDGVREVTASASVDEIPEMYPEFFGDVEFAGKLKVLSNRYYVEGSARCKARFECDISLEEFIEEISVGIKISFFASNDMLRHGETSTSLEGRERLISEDESYIDLTDEIREELTVNLPMKRIAPKYRDKALDDIYPEYSANNISGNEDENNVNTDIDERWSPLKNLKLN